MSHDAKPRARDDEAEEAPEGAATTHSSGISAIARADEAAEDGDEVARVVAPEDEIACFALGGGCDAVLAALDGSATLREVFARAGVPFAEGLAYVRTLRELGIIDLA